MELIFIITSLFIALSVLLKPSQCLQTMQPQASNDQPGLEQRHIIPALPRKLMLTEVASVKDYVVQDMGLYNTRKDHALSARMPQHKEAKMRNTNGGTWREWMERGDPYTADYSHVRRRRPIHNKSLPVAP